MKLLSTSDGIFVLGSTVVSVWVFLVTVMYLSEREGRKELKLEENFFYSLITQTCYVSNKTC